MKANPRTLVEDYGKEIVSLLKNNEAPSSCKVAEVDRQIAMDILYALLLQACKDSPEALLIVNNHGAEEFGPWRAWQTLLLKYGQHSTDSVWHALDELYDGPTSADPADRDAQLAVAKMKLITACANDSAKKESAIELYTLHYLPAVQHGNADLAQRVREKMTTDRKDVNVENWRTFWYALKAGDAVVQPANVQANFVRPQPGASKAAGTSAPSAAGPRIPTCANCKGAHRVVVCPLPCSKCGCAKRVPLPNGTSLQGHFSNCVAVVAHDALAEFVIVAGGPEPVRSSRDQSSNRDRNRNQRAKQRDQVHAHVVQYVELLGKTEDPTAKAALLEYIAEGKHELDRLRIAEDVEAANMVAAGAQPSVLPFSVDQSGYDSSYDRAGSDPHKPSVSGPSASGPTPVHSTGPSIFSSRPRQSVRTVPALLTAAALALMASFGGASVPQLVPGSYSVKRVPYLQTSQHLPVPPNGTQWSSVVVDSGCSVSVFDSPDKFRALYPSKTYLQTADKSQRIFDQRGTVVLPAVDHTGFGQICFHPVQSIRRCMVRFRRRSISLQTHMLRPSSRHCHRRRSCIALQEHWSLRSRVALPRRLGITCRSTRMRRLLLWISCRTKR